jgi:hypothetical protein
VNFHLTNTTTVSIYDRLIDWTSRRVLYDIINKFSYNNYQYMYYGLPILGLGEIRSDVYPTLFDRFMFAALNARCDAYKIVLLTHTHIHTHIQTSYLILITS